MSAFKLVKQCDSRKSAGTKAFQEGQYAQAVELFTAALSLDPLNDSYNSVCNRFIDFRVSISLIVYFLSFPPFLFTCKTILCNRAAAHAKLGHYSEVVADTTASIQLNEKYLKAYQRRAEAYIAMEQWEDGVRDLEKCTQLDPENRDLARQLKQAKVDLKKARRKDYYKILDLPKDCSTEDVKRAYKRQVH